MTKQKVKKLIAIGPYSFNTKKEFKDYLRKLRQTWGLDHPITGDDDLFLRAAARLHYQYQEKAGIGIKHFYHKSVNGDWQLWICRTDLTNVEISIIEIERGLVIRGKGINANSSKRMRINLLAAMRTMVYPWIRKWKDVYKKKKGLLFTCPVTNRICSVDAGEVDHKPPREFNAIANKFLNKLQSKLNAIGLDLQDIKLEPHPTLAYRGGEQFKSQKIRKAWIKYHAACANGHLWLLSKKGHSIVTKRRKAFHTPTQKSNKSSGPRGIQ